MNDSMGEWMNDSIGEWMKEERKITCCVIPSY